MVARFANKSNHPMYGKRHTPASLALISKPGAMNPMFGKSHLASTKLLISAKLSQVVYVYDINNKLICEFASQTLAGAHYGVYKGTIGRYIVSGKLFQGKYYLRNTLI